MFANGYKCQHLGRTSYYDSSDYEYAHTATMNFTGTSGKKIADIRLGHTRLCARTRRLVSLPFWAAAR